MRRTLLPLILCSILGTPALAQDIPAGVTLATRYSKAGRPLVAVRPIGAPDAIRTTADQVANIIGNDLRLSDRYEMIAAPLTLASGPVDYAGWNSLRVYYLVTGELSVSGAGYDLALELHDVVYTNVKQSARFTLPQATSPEFRMAVHTVSDEIVRWISNQPGMAASRVTFIRQNGGGSYDLLVVDADGHDMRRLIGSPGQIYSPVWSHDGRKVAFASSTGDGWQLTERDMAAGTTRRITEGDLIQTPAYAPDGRLYFASWVTTGRTWGLELHVFDGEGVQRVTNTRGIENLSPSVSPDGRQLAFHSNRTGRQHIYVMPTGGGNALMISPVGESAEFHAPDWSPTGNDIVFHGSSRGIFQLMRADGARPGATVTQLTSTGRSEDPSWAPDGRHIVYTGVGASGPGLYVIDVITGEIRQLVSGRSLRTPDWSGSLARTAVPGSRP